MLKQERSCLEMVNGLKSKENQEVKVQKQIETDFALALVYFSKGTLNPSEAKEMTVEVLGQVDISSRELAHKGINWLAKETLRRKNII